MSSQAHRPTTGWEWDARLRQWFCHDAQRDELVYEDGRRLLVFGDPRQQPKYYYDEQSDELVSVDGRRFPRPANVPRSIPASGTPTTAHVRTPVTSGQMQNYTHQPSGTTTQNVPRSMSQTANLGAQRKGSLPQNSGASTTQGLGNLAIRSGQNQAAYSPSDSASTVTPKAPGEGRPRLIERTDPESRVQSRIEVGPGEQITDQRLASQGLFAREKLLDTEGDEEPLYANYYKRKEPRNFFKRGRSFFTLWSEPAGASSSHITGPERARTLGRHGQQVYSKIRRFVVILEGENFCTCLPITTYSDQGVSKRGVIKSHHSIVYTDRRAPQELPAERPGTGERGMQEIAIKIDADDSSDKLNALSRLDYGKFYTIHHYLKVKNLGMVNPKFLNAFIQQFNNVLAQRVAGPAVMRAQPTMPAIMPTISESHPFQRRRASVTNRDGVQAERVAWRRADQASIAGPSNPRRASPLDRRDDSDSDGSGSESGSDSSGRDRAATRRPSGSQRPSAQAVATSRLMQRGFSAEAASQAVADQARIRQDLRQGGEGSDAGSAASSHDRASTLRSVQSRESTERPVQGARRRPSETDRNTAARTGTATSSSVHRSGRTSMSHSGGQRQQPAQSSSSSRPNPRPSLRESGNTQPAQPSNAGSGGNTSAASTAANADRAEAAIAQLMLQGLTRSQAIARLRQHLGGGGGSR